MKIKEPDHLTKLDKALDLAKAEKATYIENIKTVKDTFKNRSSWTTLENRHVLQVYALTHHGILDRKSVV